jgi:hypothetical protein
MKISKRLEAIADFVSPSDKLIDIGAKQFPIPSTMCPLRFIEYTSSTNGYYFAYEDDSCFKILIYDNESDMLYAYSYQI